MMTQKRSTKYSSATFIATPVRVLAILQLCFAFAVILSRLSYPFMGELFAFKSNKILFQYVMGTPSPSHDLAEKTSASIRASLFSKLPLTDQAEIIQIYQQLQNRVEISFFSKLIRSIHILIVELSLFERTWLVFSISIAILLLLKRPGAIYASWLLPVVALAYGLNNLWGGVNAASSPDSLLFPSEETIISKYLDMPLSSDIETQRAQLMTGWKLYLINDWANAKPSTDTALFQAQVAEGDFFFHLARLKTINKIPPLKSNPFNQRESLIVLMGYFLWNLFFAASVNFTLKENRVNSTLHSLS